MWIGLYSKPISLTMIELDFSKDSGLFDIEGVLNEKVTTSLNKKSNPCKEYDDDITDFNDCSKNIFTEYVINNGNCTTPG